MVFGVGRRFGIRTSLFLDPQAHFVADGFYFRGVHGEPVGGKGMKTAGRFGVDAT